MKRWRHTKRIAGAAFTIAASLYLALVWTGCGTEETVRIGSESFALPTDDTLTRDAMYMAKLFKEKSNGQPFIHIDFADPQQYAFVVHRLLQAGKTPSNSPRLFELLGEIRAEHRTGAGNARARETNGSGDEITTSGAGGGGSRCGHFLNVPGSVEASTYHADSAALMSCSGGMDYVSIDQAVYETDEGETYLRYLDGSWEEAYAGVEVRTPVARGSIPTGTDLVVFADSFGFASDSVTGEYESTYTRYKTLAEPPATIQRNYNEATASDATCNLRHPRDVTGDGRIRLCLKRSNKADIKGDCDYAAVNAQGLPGEPPFTDIAMLRQKADGDWVATSQKWPIPGGPVSSVPNLLLPLEGVFGAGTHRSSGQPCDIFNPRKDDTWAGLTLKTTGGWCAGESTPEEGDQLFANLRTNRTAQPGVKVNELPFGKDVATNTDNTLLVDFGPDCLEHLQDANLVLKISAQTSCNSSETGQRAEFTRTATCEMVFDVRNGCFAAGTQIRRADGTMVAVEDIQIGDAIIANQGGELLTVTSTIEGVEPEPMVRLEDSLGHELMLTAKHPVITTMGAVPADEVTVLSQVETEDGIASIVEVERVPYDGMVYNLSVGTEEEIAMFSAANRTMFAGGIRVGDNEMQFDMERQSVRESARRELSADWETDWKNSVARKQRAARK